jgi:hypothetical protein
MITFISILLTLSVIGSINYFTEIEISGFGTLLAGTIVFVAFRSISLVIKKAINERRTSGSTLR